MAENVQLGRPRGFDREAALDAAVRVFWTRGYEGASLTELTEAMGINKPSMYAAFGDKRALFAEVYERYITKELAFFFPAMERLTAAEVAEAYLRGIIRVATQAGNPGGCLLTHGALATSPDAAEVKQWMAERRLRGETVLRERFRRAQREGDLPKDADPRGLAKFLVSLAQGFNVQGASGTPAKELYAAARIALDGLRLK